MASAAPALITPTTIQELSPGLFAFEAISILLLIAVVGAIAIARPVKDDPHAGETPQAGGLP